AGWGASPGPPRRSRTGRPSAASSGWAASWWPSAARSPPRVRRGRRFCCARRREEAYSMITVPAVRLHQFGVFLYQAILGARDVDRLVRFEVLSYDSGAHGAPGPKRKAKGAPRGNWGLLEE